MNQSNEPRDYLAVFNLPVPQNEHAQIEDVIRGASGADYKKTVVGKAVIFIFRSKLPPHALNFDRVLFNSDGVLFVEIGQYASGRNSGALLGWLQSHGHR